MRKVIIIALFLVMLSLGNLSLKSVYALDVPVQISGSGFGQVCQFSTDLITIQPGSTVTFTTIIPSTILDRFGTVFGPVELVNDGDSTTHLFTTIGSFQFDNLCGGLTRDNISVRINVVNSFTDSDSDLIPDEVDNCPINSNTNQQDLDNDGLGNACDALDNRVCGIGTTPDNALGQCIGTTDSLVCGQNTEEIAGICVPNLNQICGSGTMIQNMMCVVQSVNSVVGGTLLEINTVSLLVASIGTNPVITGLVGITVAGVVGQTVWFVHRRRKSIE